MINTVAALSAGMNTARSYLVQAIDNGCSQDKAKDSQKNRSNQIQVFLHVYFDGISIKYGQNAPHGIPDCSPDHNGNKKDERIKPENASTENENFERQRRRQDARNHNGQNAVFLEQLFRMLNF